MSVLLVLFLTVPALAQTDEELSPEELAELHEQLAEYSESLTEEQKRERNAILKEAIETGQPRFSPEEPNTIQCPNRSKGGRIYCLGEKLKDGPLWALILFVAFIGGVLALMVFRLFAFIHGIVQRLKSLFPSEPTNDESTS